MPKQRLRSCVCTEAALRSKSFLDWAERIRPAWDHAQSGVPVLTHRKLWEWLFIAQALFERGKLGSGMRGLGFGVGQDPLVSLFASFGCEIVATDLDVDSAIAAGWVDGVQYASDPSQLNQYGLCDPVEFDRLVRTRSVNMNEVPPDLRGYDFTWSACAFEHLGSIDAGHHFVVEQMKCLVPGGVAVHTTEFNVSSNDETIENGPTVIFRRRDIEEIAHQLRREGYRMSLDFELGNSAIDKHVDVPPYTQEHLRVLIGSYAATSIALIVEKPSVLGAQLLQAREASYDAIKGALRKTPLRPLYKAVLERRKVGA